MIRWLFVIFLALVVFLALIPELRKLGVGRVPGDMQITLFGKIFLLPFGSTLVIFLFAILVAELQK
jgi:hypothetical protein